MPQTISKHSRRILAAVLAVLMLAVLALPLLPVPDLFPFGWGAFLGRFHPLIVHFPVVVVLLLLVVEGLARLSGRAVLLEGVPALLALAVLSCLGALGAGYLLYAADDYGGALVQSHLWGGAALTGMVLAAAGLYALAPVRTDRRWYCLYMGGLLLANGLLVYTAHLGGSLTHGEAFLTEAFPGWWFERAALEEKPQEELLVYGDLLLPALEARCQQCHNPNKAKGELVMTSFERLQRGGESERPTLVPGDPEASELYRRVVLPEGHDDHMPPEGKPGLDEDEIALMRWWIETGADPEMRLGSGPEGPALQAVLASYLPRLIHTQRRRLRDREERAALMQELCGLGERYGLAAEPDPAVDSTLFAVSMRLPPERVTDEALAALRPYAETLSRLSLVSSEVTDDGLYHLGGMRNLRALFLQKTAIDGAGLVYLQELPTLEVLNLSHTLLDDAGVLNLLRLPALKRVYLYDTQVSEPVLAALRTHLPDVEILEVEGPFY